MSDRIATQQDETVEIEAVIFDYGEVLSYRPSLDQFGRMAALFGLGVESFTELWDYSRPAYDRGDLTAEAYWLKFAAELNARIAREQIEQLRRWEVAMWSNVNSAMVRWSRQLNDAGIKTAVLSNMHADLVKHVRTLDWAQRFTVKTFSAEVRLVKPEAAIYEHTLRGLGTAAMKTLFVDDRELNIKAARSLGIRAVQFRSIPQLRDDLKGLGFPILPAET